MEHESKIAPKSDVTSPAGMGKKVLEVLGGMPKELEPKAIMKVNEPMAGGKGEKVSIGVM